MICGCGRQVEKAREELGLKICKTCAFAIPDRPKVKGHMVYGHKTAGSIQIFTNESWERNKKYYVPNGPRSCVKNFMRG